MEIITRVMLFGLNAAFLSLNVRKQISLFQWINGVIGIRREFKSNHALPLWVVFLKYFKYFFKYYFKYFLKYPRNIGAIPLN